MMRGVGVAAVTGSMLALASGCTQSIPVPKATPLKGEFVDILVDDKGCPKDVSNRNILLHTSDVKTIKWKISEAASIPQSEGPDFCIIFSPFSPDACEQDGVVGFDAISLDSIDFEKGGRSRLSVLFKYAVVLESCPTKPLDPLITVRH